MAGLGAALENLKNAGCGTVYINGSFVTNKVVPNDYDACWKRLASIRQLSTPCS